MFLLKVPLIPKMEMTKDRRPSLCEAQEWESMTLVCIVSYYSWTENSPSTSVRLLGPGEGRELGLRKHRFLTQDANATATKYRPH